MSEEPRFTIESVAVVREGDEGLYLEWTLEGGIAALECPGLVLFAATEANDMCDEDGSCELVSADDYDAKCHSAEVYFGSWKRTEEERDAALSQLAALREELASAKKLLSQACSMVNGATDEWHSEVKKFIEAK